VLAGLLGTLVGAAAIAGCASDKGSSLHPTSAPLRGMVYSQRRTPVLDMKVTWVKDGAPVQSVLSDIQGRYLFADVPLGRITLQFEKPGYEPLSWSFDFNAPTQVVYVRMSAVSELLDAAADSLHDRDWAAAGGYLARVRELEPDNRLAVFLESQLLDLQGQPAQAAAMLETLSSGPGPSFAVELALADLYEKKLARPDKALEHLKRALAIQDDPNLQSRVDALEKR